MFEFGMVSACSLNHRPQQRLSAGKQNKQNKQNHDMLQIWSIIESYESYAFNSLPHANLVPMFGFCNLSPWSDQWCSAGSCSCGSAQAGSKIWSVMAAVSCLRETWISSFGMFDLAS